MKIIKIFNNNSIAALSDELGDIILIGSGIGFQKKIGDLVDESHIEKTYIFKDKSEKRLRRGIDGIEPIYYEITSLLVNKATNKLSTQFYGEIFLAISDHIAFAIKRKKEKIDLPNVVLSETKAIYKKEYQLGLWAIKHVFEVIEQTMNIKLELDSINYARLSTHLKFLAERVFRNDIENTMDTTENIRDMLKENIRLSLCINRIKKMIKSKYNYTLAPDEQTYLCIHIKKNCHI